MRVGGAFADMCVCFVGSTTAATIEVEDYVCKGRTGGCDGAGGLVGTDVKAVRGEDRVRHSCTAGRGLAGWSYGLCERMVLHQAAYELQLRQIRREEEHAGHIQAYPLD